MTSSSKTIVFFPGGLPPRRSGEDPRRVEGRLLGGQGQSGTDRRRVAGGSFQVNSALCPFQHLVCMQVWLSPRICQDFWHCKLLQQQPQVIFLVGFGPSFNLKCTFFRSFGCFNNGLRVGWVYEVMFVNMLLLNLKSPRSFCKKNLCTGSTWRRLPCWKS